MKERGGRWKQPSIPSHKNWIAHAYVAEKGLIEPDSQEAKMWARKEMKSIMNGIDKALEKKGLPTPEWALEQIGY